MGRNSRSHEAVLRSMDEDIIPRYEELLMSLKSLCLYSVIARCEDCRALSSVSSLACVTDSDETVIFTNSCPECGGVCAPYRGELKKLRCPKCRRRLNITPIGRWD